MPIVVVYCTKQTADLLPNVYDVLITVTNYYLTYLGSSII